MFGLHWTTSGTHHSVVPTLMSGQAAQLDFTQSLPLPAVSLLLSPNPEHLLKLEIIIKGTQCNLKYERDEI